MKRLASSSVPWYCGLRGGLAGWERIVVKLGHAKEWKKRRMARTRTRKRKQNGKSYACGGEKNVGRCAGGTEEAWKASESLRGEWPAASERASGKARRGDGASEWDGERPAEHECDVAAGATSTR